MTKGHATFPTQFLGKIKFFNQNFFLMSSNLQKIAQKWDFYSKKFCIYLFFLISQNKILLIHISIYITKFKLYIVKLLFIANNSVLWNLFVKFILFCRFLSQWQLIYLFILLLSNRKCLFFVKIGNIMYRLLIKFPRS